MIGYRKFLEPGEAVAVEVPGGRNRDIWQGVTALLFIVEWVFAIVLYKLFGIERFTVTLVLCVVTVLLGFWGSRWRLLVTDRRLLRRRGPLLSRLEDIRLDEIEAVRTEAGAFSERIVIRARGRETTITLYATDPSPIARALNRAEGAA